MAPATAHPLHLDVEVTDLVSAYRAAKWSHDRVGGDVEHHCDFGVGAYMFHGFFMSYANGCAGGNVYVYPQFEDYHDRWLERRFTATSLDEAFRIVGREIEQWLRDSFSPEADAQYREWLRSRVALE